MAESKPLNVTALTGANKEDLTARFELIRAAAQMVTVPENVQPGSQSITCSALMCVAAEMISGARPEHRGVIIEQMQNDLAAAVAHYGKARDGK